VAGTLCFPGRAAVSIEDALATVSSALVQPGQQGSRCADAARWQVLFDGRQRPLLMPAGGYELQKLCLPYFVGNRLKASYAQLLLRLNAFVPTAGLLPELRLPFTARERASWAFLQNAAAHAAIQIGTPGPYQKASALLVSQHGEGLALAKIALVPSADRMVLQEVAWLRELEGMGGVAGDVPELLAEGETADGRRYLVTSLAPSTRTCTAFTPAHRNFLARLGRARMEPLNFRESPCYEYLERTLAELDPQLAREDTMQLEDALLDCRICLSGCVCPFVFTQGDFACWNIRLHQQRVFVFDWEYARLGGNPLADIFHYHLIQRAASGRSVSLRFVAKVMRFAHQIAQQLYPEWTWRARMVSSLALAYLLEVLLHYCQASGGRDRTSHVMRSYWLLMERRLAWLMT
jgi:hypothetical protein